MNTCVNYNSLNSRRGLITDTAGKTQSQSQSFDRFGNMTTKTDAQGNTTDYWYNHLNQVIKQKNAAIEIMDKDGNLKTQRPTQIYAYDAKGRALGYLDGNAVHDDNIWANGKFEATDTVFSSKIYDGAGHVIAEHHADGGWVKYEYDLLGRMVKRTWAIENGRVGESTMRYNKDDQLIEQINPRTHEIYTYDELGNRTSNLDAMGENHHYKYDTQNHVIWSNTNDQKASQLQYDGQGRKTKEIDALGGITEYVYDDLGRLTSKTNTPPQGYGDKHVITYEYNADNQLINEKTDGTLSIEYTYYKNGLTKSIADKVVNNIQSFEYDSAGRKTREHFIQYNADNSTKLDRDTTLKYNARGDLIDIKNKDYHLQNFYDASGNKRQVTVKQGDKEVQATEYQYDAANRISDKIVNGVHNHVLYDFAGDRVTDVQGGYKYDDEGYLISGGGIERKYDLDGRVISTINHNKNNETRNTYYNKDGQIDHEDILGATNSHIEYKYDEAGNMTSHTMSVDGGNGTQGYTNTYTRTYDGYKLASEKGESSYFEPGQEDYAYDARGRLSGTHDERGSHDQSFILDANGQIIQKTENGAVSNYYFEDGKYVGEVDADGKVDFDNNYTPVSEHYPAMTPKTVTVMKGAQLSIIAAEVYGDSSQWFRIAEANGIKDDSGLVEGMILTIPNQITNTHATSNTFKIFSNDSVIGDTTPTLPTPPPPDDDDGGCGGIGQALIIAVTIVATIATAGAAAIGMGATTAAGGGVFSAGLGAITGGMAGGITGGIGAAGMMASAFVGGTVGSLAGQAVGNLEGIEHGFDLGGALINGLTSAIGSGIGYAAGGANVIAKAGQLAAATTENAISEAQTALNAARQLSVPMSIASGVAKDASGQLINMAANQAHAFNWKETLSEGITSALGAGPLQNIGQNYSLPKDIALSLATQAYSQNGHVDAASIIGNSIGNLATQALVQNEQAEYAQRVYEEEEEELASPSVMTKAQYEAFTGAGLNTDSACYAGTQPIDQMYTMDYLKMLQAVNGSNSAQTQAVETAKAQAATDSNTAWRDKLTLKDKAELIANASRGGMQGKDLDNYARTLFGTTAETTAAPKPVVQQLWQDENGVQHEGDDPYFPHDRMTGVNALTAYEMSSTIGDQKLMQARDERYTGYALVGLNYGTLALGGVGVVRGAIGAYRAMTAIEAAGTVKAGLGLLEATAGNNAIRSRVLGNIAESQAARNSSNFNVLLAKSDQLKWGYNADEWTMINLSKGTKLYGGLPGQSAYYTNAETLSASGNVSEDLFTSLQVRPHPEFGYRPEVGVYELQQDTRVPFGIVEANPAYGVGNGAQYFVNNYNNLLKLTDRIPLRLTQ